MTVECDACGGVGTIGGLIVGNGPARDETCVDCYGSGLVRRCELCGQERTSPGRLCIPCRRVFEAERYDSVDELVDRHHSIVQEADERVSFDEYRAGRSL